MSLTTSGRQYLLPQWDATDNEVPDVGPDTIDIVPPRRLTHLWAESGWLDPYYAKDAGALGIWRQWAPRVQGQSVKGGHFFPEENPDDTAILVKQFLQTSQGRSHSELEGLAA